MGRQQMNERRALPHRRETEAYELRFWGQPWHVSIGYYSDGLPGEVFINALRTPGTELDAVSRDAAILLSLTMQYGVPLDVIRNALTRNQDGSPSSIAGAVADRLVVNHA